MPQEYPPYSKLIFISYDSDQDFALWLYQRLKYALLPVWTYGADNNMGGGFADNSIRVTSPMIAVVSKIKRNPDDHKIYSSTYHNMVTAKDNGKEIVIALLDEDNDILDQFPSVTIFDFRQSRNEAFEHLKQNLLVREYPAPRNSLPDPNGNEFLRLAREEVARIDRPHTFYLQKFYIQVFNDLHNKSAKIGAIRDLGELQILSGLVFAALQSDPQEDVRAEAALALAKFAEPEIEQSIYEAAQGYPSGKVALYARLALAYRKEPNLIRDIVSDLSEVFLTVRNNLRLLSPSDKRITDDSSSDPFAHHFFISYARRDADKHARNLADTLSQAGFSVWIDTTRLEAGTSSWTHDIHNAIRQASTIIVLLSPAVMNSEWVDREIAVAQELSKVIIPIRVFRGETPLRLATNNRLRDDPVYTEEPEKVFDMLMETMQRRGINPRTSK